MWHVASFLITTMHLKLGNARQIGDDMQTTPRLILLSNFASEKITHLNFL